MPSDAKLLIREITEAVKNDDVDLTPWETEFMESIGSVLEAGFGLSDKQDACLEKIWRKATGRSQ